MRCTWYRGRRIRKWDDRLILRSVIFCIVLSTVAGILLVWQQSVIIPLSERPLISQIATVVLFDIMMLTALFTAVKRQGSLYENLENRQELARMVIGNMWYETDLRSNSKGEQDITYMPRLYYWRRRSITYFPRIYYRKKDRKIYITVKINMGKYQEQLLHLESKIETGLDCEVVEANYQHKWMYYTFFCDPEQNRISIDQMIAQDGSVRFMNHILWDYDRHPHALIVGDTGSGKTYLLLSIVEILLDIKAKLFIVDAKNADLAGLETILPDVFYKEEDIKECVYRFYDDMTKRMADIKSRSDYTPGKNYRYYGLTANFLIFDEYVAYMEMLPKKEWEEVISVLKKIVLLGRQAGFFLILTCQRPDAKYLPDGIRDQFGLRVALGAMGSSGYTMMFGNTDKNFIEKDISGRGYVKLWNGVITEFYAPLIPPDHDFMDSMRDKGHFGGTAAATPCELSPDCGDSGTHEPDAHADEV